MHGLSCSILSYWSVNDERHLEELMMEGVSKVGEEGHLEGPSLMAELMSTAG